MITWQLASKIKWTLWVEDQISQLSFIKNWEPWGSIYAGVKMSMCDSTHQMTKATTFTKLVMADIHIQINTLLMFAQNFVLVFW